MRIEYAKDAVKAIAQLDKNRKQQIRKAIEAIPQGDIKPLRDSSRLYRLCDRRIVFSFPEPGMVLIERIAPRGDIYKGGLL